MNKFLQGFPQAPKENKVRFSRPRDPSKLFSWFLSVFVASLGGKSKGWVAEELENDYDKSGAQNIQCWNVVNASEKTQFAFSQGARDLSFSFKPSDKAYPVCQNLLTQLAQKYLSLPEVNHKQPLGMIIEAVDYRNACTLMKMGLKNRLEPIDVRYFEKGRMVQVEKKQLKEMIQQIQMDMYQEQARNMRGQGSGNRPSQRPQSQRIRVRDEEDSSQGYDLSSSGRSSDSDSGSYDRSSASEFEFSDHLSSSQSTPKPRLGRRKK